MRAMTSIISAITNVPGQLMNCLRGNTRVPGMIRLLFWSFFITVGLICGAGEVRADGKPLWTRQIGDSPGNSYANAVAVDSTGNSYITGKSNRSFDSNTFYSFFDMVIVKYDVNGTKKCSAQYGAISDDIGAGVALDASGNIYVTGTTSGWVGDGTGANAGTGRDIFVMKYDSLCNKIWSRQFGSNVDDNATGIAVDLSGNLYVTGTTNGWIGDGTGTVTGAGTTDLFLMKFDVSGTTPAKVWSKQIGSTGNDSAYGVATDSSGNAYITGSTGGWLSDGTGTNTGTNMFLMKYNSSGTKLWARQIGTTITINTGTIGKSVAVDEYGNVYITGTTMGSLDGQVHHILQHDFFLLKYDSSGNLIWLRQFGSDADDDASSVAVDLNGDIVITGSTQSSFYGNWYEGSLDLVVVKFSPAGEMQWSKQLGSSGYDQPTGIAVGGKGDIYIAGYTSGGLDGNTNSGGGVYDMFLVKYDGTREWSREFGSSVGDTPYAVAVDEIGNVFVTGWTAGGLDDYVNAGYTDIFITSYTSLGTKRWSRQIGGPYYQYSRGIAVDPSRNLYVAGNSEGGLDGNTGLGYRDMVLLKYDNLGNKLWSKQVGGCCSVTSDEAYGVAVDSAGNAYVAGYTGSTSARDSIVRKFDPSGVLLKSVIASSSGPAANEVATGIAIDSSGNVYIVGSTAGWLGDTAGSNAGANDIFIIKYDSTLTTRYWSKQYGTAANDDATGIAVDSTGNIYVTGTTTGWIADGTGTVSGTSDAFLMKLEPVNGNRVWTRQLGVSAVANTGNSVAVDSNGEVLVYGTTSGALDGNTQIGQKDMFLTKYSSGGTKLWTKQFGTDKNDTAGGMAYNGAGQVYVAGTVQGSFDGNPYLGADDGVLIKFKTDSDSSYPTGTVTITTSAPDPFYTKSSVATLSLTCKDGGGCDQMRFSNDNLNWSDSQPFSSSISWTLDSLRDFTKVALLTITNFQANFQTKLVVSYLSGMQSDFADIRFYDATAGTLLPYWVESKTNGTSATVWFKTGTNNNIYLVYGNAAVLSASNGTATFEFFDDFNLLWYDTGKWTITNGTGFSLSDGLLHGTNTTGRLTSKATFSAGVTQEVKARTAIGAANGQMVAGFGLTFGPAVQNNLGFLDHPGNLFSFNNSNYTLLTATTAGSNMLYSVTVKNSTQVDMRADNLDTSTMLWSGTSISNAVTAEPIVIGRRYDDGYLGQTYSVDWDWIRVRKYFSTQPTVTVGASISIPVAWNSDGWKPVYAQFMDYAGNWSANYTHSIYLDTTPPVGGATPLSISGGTAYTKSTQVSLALSATDTNLYQMMLSNDVSFTNVLPEYYSSYRSWDIPAGDSLKTVYVKYGDRAGNWSPVYSDTITLDTAVPSSYDFQISGGATVTKSQILSLTSITCTDAGWSAGTGCSQMQFKNESGPWFDPVNLATSTSWALSAGDGTKTVHARFIDTAGNPSTFDSPKSILLDTTPPTGTIAITGGLTRTKNATVALDLTCSDVNGILAVSGCSRMQFSNNGTTWGSITPGDGLDALVVGSKTGWPLASGDGSKSIYVRFKDIAGNWSLPLGPASITLDTTLPVPDFTFTGTVKDGSNSDFTKYSSLILNISSNESGMGQMQFCIAPDPTGTCDTADWSSAVSFGSSKTLTLSGDGLKKIGMQASDGADNWSVPIYKTITLDTSPPVTTASPAAGSSTTSQLFSISCDDNGGIDKNSCVHSYYSLDKVPPVSSSPPATLYTAPFSISKDTTVRFYSVDTLGNPEQEKSAAYTFIRGYTAVTLVLTDSTIDNGKSESVFGRLINLSGNNANLVGEKITINIKDSKGNLVGNHDVTINDPLGSYSTTLPGTNFSIKDAYTITAVFTGSKLSDLLAPSSSVSSTLLVGASAGYAILIEGKVPNDVNGLNAHNLTTNRIYSKLLNRGFTDSSIYYFNYDKNQLNINVDEIPNAVDIQDAIENWAKVRMNSNPAPLYIIMVDHGSSDGKFRISNENILPSDLATWLGNLENGIPAVNGNPAVPGLSPDALKQKRFIINGSCYSGTFISELSQAPTDTNGGRVIVTSAATDEVSYKGPNEGADSQGGNIHSGEFFLEEFFTQLERGNTFRQSFIDASAATRIFTQKDSSVANSNAPYFDGAVQHPLLDDNGDGIGSNALFDGAGQDGEAVRNATFGAGGNYTTYSGENPADIIAVTDTIRLGSTETGALLWATVNDNTLVDSAVWMEIRTPTLVLNPAGSTLQADLDTRWIPLTHYVDTNLHIDRWQQDPSDPGGVLAADLRTPFTASGKYEIFYFVRDYSTQKLAPMKRSVVYKADSVNDPLPGAFDLLTPAPGSTQLNMIVFSWTPSTPSAPTNPVTYTLLIASDSSFTADKIVYKQEEISGTMIALGSQIGLQHDKEYYWKVVAIDKYGAQQDSNQKNWHFHTNFPNDPFGVIQGFVRDTSKNAIVGATVHANGFTQASNEFGAFAFVVTGGTYTVYATKNGLTSPVTVVTVAGGGNKDVINVMDLIAPIVTKFTLSSGYSGLTIPITELTATDNAGPVTLYCITEVNSPAGCSWGAKPANVNVTSNSALSLYAWAKDAVGNISSPFINNTMEVAISGDGNGRVYSAPVNIDCRHVPDTPVICSSLFNYNSTVSLIASPDWNAIFGGWGGVTCSGTGACGFNPLSASKIVTATFIARKLVQVGTNEYSSLQVAYNTAPLTGSTIKAREYTFEEDLKFDIQDKVVTIAGGKADNYSDQVDKRTTIKGTITIKQGTVSIRGPLAVR